MQGVSTFLNRNGIAAAKPILKEMSFPPTIVVLYAEGDMLKFFEACDEAEELIFKFFLHSMARDMEVANCEVRDLKIRYQCAPYFSKAGSEFSAEGKAIRTIEKGPQGTYPRRLHVAYEGVFRWQGTTTTPLPERCRPHRDPLCSQVQSNRPPSRNRELGGFRSAPLEKDGDHETP